MSQSSKTTRILVIEDEPEMRNNYERILTRAGHTCHMAPDPSELAELLERVRPHLVITDLMMPNGSGMNVLEEVHRWDDRVPVIMITAFGSVENAVEAMKRHAADYLTKPFSMGELLEKVQEAMSRRIMDHWPAGRAVEGVAETEEWRRDIVGLSGALNKVLQLVRKVARTDVNVLIQGDSGTGKEVVARAIHRLSPRKSEIFVPVDCASLPENLLESELFGYVKGAFTGANSDKKGLFEFAHKGTLFLDEIGEMPLALQSKLLRVLQERQFRRIGGRHQIAVDVRVIAATNRDLSQAVQEKIFRSDLYYRLKVVSLPLPTLRERPEDIPLLADHFLRRFAADNRISTLGISQATMKILLEYPWPGNVRELQNVIEHAATLASGPEIEPEDLPSEVGGVEEGDEEEDPNSLLGRKEQLVEEFEREYLVSLLVEHDFNISRAARTAGCHRRTLYRIIHRQGIDLEKIQEERRAARERAARHGEEESESAE